MLNTISEIFKQGRFALFSKTTPTQNAPITHLPNEILIVIFEFSAQDISISQPRIKNSPFSLTHICREWRSLATNVGELWTRYTVQHLPAPTDDFKGRVELGRLFFSRAGGRPLDITIRLPNEDVIVDDLVKVTFWEWLFPTAELWGNLRIKGGPFAIVYIIARLGNVKNLRRLEIFDGGFTFRRGQGRVPSQEAPAQALFYELPFYTALSRPWISLRIFDARNIWMLPRDLVEFVRDGLVVVEVVRVRLFPGDIERIAGAPPPLISRHTLNELELITSGHIPCVFTVLQALGDVPNVTHLTLRNCDNTTPPLSFSSKDLAECIDRRSCTIDMDNLVVSLKENFVSDDL